MLSQQKNNQPSNNDRLIQVKSNLFFIKQLSITDINVLYKAILANKKLIKNIFKTLTSANSKNITFN